MSNIQLADQIIKDLVHAGVETFCFCPGGRLAPFVEVLSQSQGVSVESFFDERSAGFFALGRAEKDKKPVCVLTTSGTAVAHLLAPVIEAHYSGLPLILITTDRPLGYGAFGTPQTLKQPIGFFNDYVTLSKNVTHLKDWKKPSLKAHGIYHFNVHFDEPLVDKTLGERNFHNQLGDFIFDDCEEVKKDDLKKLDLFFSQVKNPLILLGELKSYQAVEVKKYLKDYKGLLYAEPLSQLNHMSSHLFGGEKILTYGLHIGAFDGMIRIGGVPRCRFWRDLEKISIPILNLPCFPYYSGISRESVTYPFFSISSYLKNKLSEVSFVNHRFQTVVSEQYKKWSSSFSDLSSLSEIQWVRSIKASLPEGAEIFLGNSLPIRLWDLVSFSKDPALRVKGQSGVNGIDGLVSRFFGGLGEGQPSCLLIGDLSLLYDISGFWEHFKRKPFTVIVINNYGGQIFHRLFSNPQFLNSHTLSFEGLAKLWNLDYELRETLFDSKSFSHSSHRLVEVRPDSLATDSHFRTYDSLWDTFLKKNI